MPKPKPPEQQPAEQHNPNDTAGTALVPVTDEQTALAAWKQTSLPCVTSLNTKSNAGMCQAITAMGTATFRGKDVTKREIRVCDWLVHKVTPIVSQDGSEGVSMRLVLITDTGETIATRAPAVLDRWRMIVQAARLLSWRWPIVITLGLHPAGQGREYLEIVSQRPS